MEKSALKILSGAIGEVTNWFVITGAPGSGKTKVLLELSSRGYRVSHDVSRAHLEEQFKIVGDKYKIREDEFTLQRDILWKMIVAEEAQPKEDVVFLEYALPDNLAFWKLANLSLISEVVRAAERYRYKHIFLLENLPLSNDYIRTETTDYQNEMYSELQVIYKSLGYTPTIIPAGSIDERIKVILGVLHSYHFT